MTGIIYELKKEHIDSLKKQIDITDEKAEELLLKHNGDIVECVLESYNFKDKTKKKESENDTITKLRHIVNDKNKIYQQNIKENQVNNNSVKVI